MTLSSLKKDKSLGFYICGELVSHFRKQNTG